MSTQTARKLRFPVLIGSGVIAAGILVYFANGYINSQKTQGAIGHRDVYRDGEVKAADVAATPGAAPVAIKAILESKEFKSLANNSDFQAMVTNASFNTLVQSGFLMQVLSASNTNAANQNVHELLLQLNSASASQSAAQNAVNQLSTNQSFNNLLQSQQFLTLASNANLASLLTTASFWCSCKH